MRVSVVVCTYNRADGLRAALDSLRQQRFRDFEVVVVNGPSTDHTTRILRTYRGRVRVVDNPLANLSASRNLGIRAAAGEIVAFIDDDALPEPGWLEQAVAPFDDPEVGGVGGIVLDHTGMSPQYRYSAATRFGEPVHSLDQPFDAFSVPGAATFPYLQGTNALFRREALARIGLFDETFDFYLDETDVCCRLVDAGYVLRQLPNAVVHHKYLPSARRNAAKVVTNWASIVRNHVYFGYRHALLASSEFEVLDHTRAFRDLVLRDAAHHESLGNVLPGHVDRAMRDCDAAIAAGMKLARDTAERRIEPAVLDDPGFAPFLEPDERADTLRILLVSSGYTPNLTGGIARFISDVAPELARRGHEVRVFTRADEVETVDLEDGVWVHRLLPVPTPGRVPEATAPIDAFASAVANELERIAEWWCPDVMYGSLWDVEMLGIARTHAELPMVPMLATPVLEVAEHEGWTDRSHEFHRQAKALALLEREVVARAACVHAISESIIATFERLYPGALHRRRCAVAPIGRADDIAGRPAPPPTDAPLVTFIGRLEPRKGIDTFLAAARHVLAANDRVRVAVAGDANRPGPSGQRYPDWWRSLPDAGADRVSFLGMISDDELVELLSRSLVVVMPSRYESFGLVAVEAMMHGRAIVASNVGGLAELIDDGVDGLLVQVGDDDALAEAIVGLLNDLPRAASIGKLGRVKFEEQLTASAAAARLEGVLRRVAVRRDEPAKVLG